MRRNASRVLAGAILGFGLVAFPAKTAPILFHQVDIPVLFDPVEIDLDADSAVDFWLLRLSGCSRGGCSEFLFIQSFDFLTTRVLADSSSFGSSAPALEPGAPIGPGSSWSQAATMIGMNFNANDCEGTTFDCGVTNTIDGYWLDQSNRYLGLRLDRGGLMHYGWARLNVFVVPNGPRELTINSTLTGYALNLEPGQSIAAGAVVVPEPSTLSLLGLGCAALAALRRRRRQGKT
jgi:hypothetical protein